MRGGTDFYFVTDGIHVALERATAAANADTSRVSASAMATRQFLRARLIDELHLPLRPVLMGSGEKLWDGIDMHALGYECANTIAGERATHVFLRKRT